MPSSDLAIDGKTATGDEQFDWEWLVSQAVHPMKVAIVEAIRWIGQPVTPNDLFNSFDQPGSIGAVSHHVHELAKMGVLRSVRKRQIRGATETYYFFARAVWTGA